MNKTIGKTSGKRALALMLTVVMFFSLFIGSGLTAPVYADGVNWVHLDGAGGRPNMPGHAVALTAAGFATLAGTGAAHQSIHTIHLGADISRGTSIALNRNMTVDGFDPRNPAQVEPFQLTRAGGAIFGGTTARTVRFQNLRIRNQNNSGLIGTRVGAWQIHFDNVTASGHQFVDNPSSTVVLHSNNLFHLHDNYGAGFAEEFAELHHLRVEGPNNIIRRTGPGGFFSFLWITLADGTVVVNPGASVVFDMNGFCPDIYGFTYATGARTTLTVHDGGSFRFYGGRHWDGSQTITGGRMDNIHINGEFAIIMDGNIRNNRFGQHLVRVSNFNVNRGANAILAARGGSNAVLEVRSALTIREAEQFVIYHGGTGRALAVGTGVGSFSMPNNRRVGTNTVAVGLDSFTFGATYMTQDQYERDAFVLGPIGFQANTAANMANFRSDNYHLRSRAPWAVYPLPADMLSNANVRHVAIYGDFSSRPNIDVTFAGDRVIRGTGVPGSYITIWLPDTVGFSGPFGQDPVNDIEVAADGTWEFVLPPGANLMVNHRIIATQREFFTRPGGVYWHSSESDETEILVFERTIRLEGDNINRIYYEDGTVATNATVIFGVNAGEIVIPPSELRFVQLIPGSPEAIHAMSNEDDAVSFETLFNALPPEQRGVVGVTGMSSGAIPIRYNTVVWVQGTVNRNGNDVVLGATREFLNLFQIRHLYVRGMVSGPPMIIDGIYHRMLYTYRRMTTPAGGTQYGVPLAHNGQVIANPTGGFDTVRVQLNPQFHFHWEGIIRGSFNGHVNGANMSVNNPPLNRVTHPYWDFRLDQEFHNATNNQLWDAGQARNFYFYTIEYSPIPGMWWQDVPVFLRASDPVESNVYFDLGAGPTAYTTINMPIDINYQSNMPVVPYQSTRFLHYGGHFEPPSDEDQTPTGWFVSPVWNFALNRPTSDFSNPVQFNPEVVPLAGVQRLYVTYELGRITIHEYFYGVETYRPAIAGTRTTLQGRTTHSIEGGPSNPGFTSTAPLFSGRVPVGYHIEGVPGRNGYHLFDFATFMAANPGTCPTFNQNALQAVLTNANLAAVPGPVRIRWFYAADSTGSGIPDQEKGTLQVNWHGFYLNNAIPAIIAPSQTIRVRVGFDFTVHNNMNDLPTPATLGDPEHVIVRSPFIIFPGTWLFDRWPNNPLHPLILPYNPPSRAVNIPVGETFANSPANVTEVAFLYAFATDNNMADKNQFVIEQFRVLDPAGVEGTNVAMPADNVVYLLRGQTYLRTPPTIPGFLFVGYRIDNGANNITYVNGELPAKIQFNTANYNVRVTLLYREQAPPVTVNWVGTTMASTELVLYNMTFIGYVGEEMRVDIREAGLPTTWVREDGTPEYFDITFGGTTPQTHEFRVRETLDLSVITIRFFSTDYPRTIEFVMTSAVLPNSAPMTVPAMTLADHDYVRFDVYDAHGNQIQAGTADSVVINPALGSQTLTFWYEANTATVVVRAFNANDGTEFTAAAVSFTDASIGEPFAVQAPHIPGYVLADGEPLTQLVYPVRPGVNEVRFNFVPAEGNIAVVLREGTFEAPGPIIRVDSVVAAPGETIAIPNLTMYHFDAVPGQTPYVVTDTSETVTYFYTKRTIPVYIRAIDEATGDLIVLPGIVTSVTEQGRLGQMHRAVALDNIPGFTLVDSLTRTVFVDPARPEIIINFLYRKDTMEDVIVRHYFINEEGVEEEIHRFVVAAIVESRFQANVMDLEDEGFIPHEDTPALQSITVSATENNIISFRYVDVRLTVTVEYWQYIDGVSVLIPNRSVITRVAEGKPFNYTPTYLIGHTLNRIMVGNTEIQEISIPSVAEDTVIRIYFEQNHYPVAINVRGINRTTGAELYAYTLLKNIDSGAHYVYPFDLAGFELVRRLVDGTVALPTPSGAVQVTVEDNDINVTFEYESLLRPVTIMAVMEGTTNPVQGFTPIVTQAMAGQPFSHVAPVIPGFNLVWGHPSTQVIHNVTADSYTLYFEYEVAVGNLILTLIEGEVGEPGRIIRTTSQVLEAGVPTTVNAPDLSAYGYTLVAGQLFPREVTYTGTPIRLSVYYTKDLRAVEIIMINDYDGSEIGRVAGGNHRVGEATRIYAPFAGDDFVLMYPSPRMVLINAGAGAQEVIFRYRSLAENELQVLALDVTNPLDYRILQSSVIRGTVGGGAIRVTAPVIHGFILEEGQVAVQSGFLGETVTFRYVSNLVPVLIEMRLRTEDGDRLRLPIMHQVIRGSTQTFWAPHIPGHVVNGTGVQTLVNIDGLEIITFTYTPIEDIIDEFTTVLTVVGRAGTAELYRYTVVRGRNSGAHTVTAFEPSGFRLIGGDAARTHTFIVGEIPLEHVFEYESLATHVTIHAVHYVEGVRVAVSNFTPFQVPATEGQPFSQTAPHIAHFNLVGNLTQTIEEVGPLDNTLTFLYERAVGNVVIELREGSITGPIIRTESRDWAAGVEHTVVAPDLSADFFTALAPTSWTGIFDGSPLTIVFVYEKQLVDVTVRGVYVNDPAQYTEVVITGVRRGEVHTFNAPAWTGFALLSHPTQMVLITTTDAVVTFEYRQAGDGEVHVLAVRYVDGVYTIIYDYVIETGLGGTVTVAAPTLLGYVLRQDPIQTNPQTATAPGTIRFVYVPDVVHVTLVLQHHTSGAPIAAPAGVATVINVPRGGDITVFAPHIAGHVITGLAQRSFTNLQEPQNAVFLYIPIEEIVDEFTVVLRVEGRDTAGTLLYGYNVVRGRNSGAHTVTAFEPSGFRLIGGDAARTHTFIVGEIPLTHTFEYESLATQVQIRAVDNITDELLPNFTPFYMPATIGQPFSHVAPHIQNFNLIGAQTQSLASVSENAADRVLTFRYERAIGNVVIELREGSVTGPIIRTESRDWAAGVEHTVAAPDLSADFFTVIGETSWTGIFDGSPLTIVFVYEKQLVDVTVRGVYVNDPAQYTEVVITGVRRGEVHTFNAPAWTGFALLSHPTQMVLITTTDAVVTFEYRQAGDGEVHVVAQRYVDGVYTIIYDYIIETGLGGTVTVAAPTLLGYVLRQDPVQTNPQTATAPGTIRFVYVPDVVPVTLVLQHHTSGAPIAAPAGVATVINVPRGGDITVFAPHISGHVITGVAQRSFANLQEPQNAVFLYIPIEEIVYEFTTVLTVVGRAGTTELYRYTVVRGRNSGAHTVTAFEPSGFRLIGGDAARMHTFIVGEIPLEHVFEYESLATSVTIRAVEDATGMALPVSVFVPFEVQATIGQPFTHVAPHIPNFNLAGDLSQTILSVSENSAERELIFRYERAVGNVIIELREGSVTGPIIRTESRDWTAGEMHTVNAPNLSADFFDLAGEASWTGIFDGLPLTIVFVYEKQLVDVTVRGVYVNDPAQYTEVVITGVRRGEVHTFNAPAWVGFVLLSHPTQNVLITGTDEIVIFNYRQAGDDDIHVIAVRDIDGVYSIIYDYIITAGAGTSVTVSAPTLLGYILRADQGNPQTAMAGSYIRFVYVPNLVVVNLELWDNHYQTALTAPVGTPTTFTVPRGGSITVFAPHIPGFVIDGAQSATLTTNASDTVITVTFFYMPTIVFSTITITFDANGGLPATQVATDVIVPGTYEGAFNQGIVPPTRQGFNFAGWNTSPDGTGETIVPLAILHADAEDHTIYAQWIEAGHGNLYGFVTRSVSTLIEEIPVDHEPSEVIEYTYEYEVEVSFDREVEVQYEYDVEVEYEYEVEVEYEYEVEVPYSYEVEVPYTFENEEGDIVSGTMSEIREGTRAEMRTGTRTEIRTETRTETHAGVRIETESGSRSETRLGTGTTSAAGSETLLPVSLMGTEPLEGVTIIIIPANGDPVIETTTNEHGMFDQVVPAGDYTVIASFSGYKIVIHQDSPHTVNAGGRTRADFTLVYDEYREYQYLLAIRVMGGPDNDQIDVTFDGDDISQNRRGIVWAVSGSAPMTGLVTATADGFSSDARVVMEDDYDELGNIAVITLAIYELAQTVMVTFAGNGGTPETQSRLMVVGAEYNFVGIATPTRANHVFTGWFTAATGGTQIVPGMLVPDTAQTLFAQWAPVTTNIVGGGGGGETIIILQPEPPLVQATDLHIAFVRGFPDGSFRPGQSITRAEIAMILFRLIESDAKYLAQTSRFSDVASGMWYAQAINYLASREMLRGYEDGTFRPNQQITRAELTAIISRFAETRHSGTNNFADVADYHWALSYIISAHSMGWILGYEDGTFRPDNATTRAEAVTMINRVFNRIPNPETIRGHLAGQPRVFNDLNNAHWAFYQIMEAAIEHTLFFEQGREIWVDVIFQAL